MPSVLTDGTPVTDTWRVEFELFTGTETFRNNFDVRQLTGFTDTPPGEADPIITALTNWIIANYFPAVTLNAIFLRNIYKYTTPPPHVVHPPIWEISSSATGTANTTYGGPQNSNFLPQDVCIYVKKTTSGGRNGKLFMRNILTEVDVQSTLGGVWAFSPGAGHFDPAVFNAAAVSLLGAYLGGSHSPDGYTLAVTHLEATAPTDTRPAYSTNCSFVTCVRPTWNKTKR
jgi:hypothetical protein